MKYVSTRDNYPAGQSAEVINVGMVPGGGLFVPRDIPAVNVAELAAASYNQTARCVLNPLLTDFSSDELGGCVEHAYNLDTFDIPQVIAVKALGAAHSIMELWHGPTAAFKDVALQIMPHFLAAAKAKLGESHHTVILVATSGDTGKAALEGFRDCAGISIIVFYPEEGVSEIQKSQMVTTEGSNTSVVAVKGNFDDCQSGVKSLFSDAQLRGRLATDGFAFSSANSINWGRLCPQIVYYVQAYAMLVQQRIIAAGDPINFCVPTGNFGNILAAYYAKRMGLPIKRLLCASNKNKILADFFESGIYDKNRTFYRTTSPSMDILISSNLERFLFEVTGHDAAKIRAWYTRLAETGRFEVDADTKARMDAVVTPGWVNEPDVLHTIGTVYRSHGYVIDTHTAVAVAMSAGMDSDGVHTVVDSTASPYKFSRNVVAAIGGKVVEDEFESIEKLHELTGLPVHRAVEGLREKRVRHTRTIAADEMRATVLDILKAWR